MKSMNERWQEADIQALIDDSVEEGQHLDYKDSRALSKADWKKDVCKDVSAMANADGGVIIYGVTEAEFQDGKKRKIRPQGFDDGIDPAERSKEQIVQVINDGLQRRPEFFIDKVELSNNPGRVCYVIRVPKSLTGAHQLTVDKDYRYYQRQETETKAMQDWQIRDVMNRQTGPDLSIKFSIDMNHWAKGENFPVCPTIQNSSKNPAEYAFVTLWIDIRLAEHSAQSLHFFFESIKSGVPVPVEAIGEKNVSAYKGVIVCHPRIPIFGSKDFTLIKSSNDLLPLRLPRNEMGFILDDYYLQWEIEAPGMTPKRCLEKFSVHYASENELRGKWESINQSYGE